MSIFSPESDWSESLTRVIDFLKIMKIMFVMKVTINIKIKFFSDYLDVEVMSFIFE